jgi:carbonic anhydrase/acetyltransferase-like protein (isoleucine patch superfamily)
MSLYSFQQNTPQIDAPCYVADTAAIIGKVHLKTGANIWFGAVLRGDNELIHIGLNSNVQENSVLHTDLGCPLNVGAHVTIGHSVTLHGCTIGENSLIGMGAIVLNRAVVGANSIVGAGSLITEGKVFPDGVLIMGSPAKVARLLTNDEIAQLPQNALQYAARGQAYASGLQKITATPHV